MLNKKLNKEEVVENYSLLLGQKYFDDEILRYIEELISTHHELIEMNPELVKINGALPTIYRYYMSDKNACISKLKKCSPSELKVLEEQIELDERMMAEILQAIKNEENIRTHQAEMQKLEKYLTLEEIDTIKNEYLKKSLEDELKR